MTQEKELLLKDLCARLPYNIKVEAKGLLKTIENDYNDRNIINAHVLNGLNLGNHFKTYSINNIANIPLFNRNGVCNIKPYLFPLSSMTEEQKEEYYSLADDVTIKPGKGSYFGIKIHCIKLGISDNPHEGLWDWVDLDAIDWLNKNHFDYRGLIEEGLAIDATNKNIY